MEKTRDMVRKGGIMPNPQGVIKGVIIWLFLLMTATLIEIHFPDAAFGAQTTGGVNWIDPLGYTKPAFYPITVPDETSATKYYTVLSGGSGSACTSTTPCNFNTVSRSSGPAYIYVKAGSGGKMVPNSTLYGSAGNEIVIKPWPGDSNIVLMQAAGSNSPGLDISGSNNHHIIIDGGANLQFEFKGQDGCSDQNTCWTARINSNYITLARSRLHAGTAYGATMGIAEYVTGVHDVSIINNEFYDSNNVTAVNSNVHIYLGQCACSAGCSSFNNVYIRNNIFRDAGTEGMESNPRGTADTYVVNGNAFHNLGKLSCNNTTWYCRPAIVFTNACGGTLTNHYATNNLIFDIGAGGMWLDGDTQYIYNNTIYDYGKGTGVGVTRMTGINSYTSGVSATIQNNIIYAPNGQAPFGVASGGGTIGGTKTNNICSGTGCVSAYNANTFLSVDPTNSNFLKIGSNSNARDAGAIISIVTTDYMGASRGSTYDIGSFEYGIAPMPPALVSVQ